MVMKKYLLDRCCMNQLSKLLLIVLTLLTVNNLSAQENGEIQTIMSSTGFKKQNVIPPSPEAAGLGKFGNIPISLFTGTPNVGIPLYDLKGNQLNVPISMSYNASGFNPQEVAGWIGLGWNLMAGGIITRSVIGNPDVTANYFKLPSPLEVPATSDLLVYYDYLENIRKGYHEAQPDIYYFNFAGNSGKFMIKPDGSIVMLQKNNLVVSHCINSCTPETSVISIKDPSGITYSFTATEISFTTTDDASTDVPVLQHTYASSWLLTSIISPDNSETIVLEYHAATPYHYPYAYNAVNQSKVYEFTLNSTNTAPNISIVTSNPPVTGIKRRYLQKITFKKNGQDIAYADFNSSVDQREDLGHSFNQFQGERLLNNIQIFLKSTDLAFKKVKQFNFSYSYFTNPGVNDWKYKRLRLDQIQEVSVDVATPNTPPYVFEYDNSSAPAIGTGAVDHWGFLNNNVDSYTTTPESNYSNGQVVITGSNRLPNLSGSKALILTKIKYPTGGSTSFEYELHTANVIDMGVMSVGGVRIKKMVDYSAENQKAIEKTYEYLTETGVTSGKAKYPSYKNISTYKRFGQQLGGWFNPCYGTIDIEKQYVNVSASSVIGLGSIMGSHIGYSRVVEQQVDIVNGQPLGKTVYEYETTGNWGEMQNEDGKNGELLKQTTYDNADKIIQQTTNIYEDVVANGSSIFSISIMTSPDQDNKISLYKTNHTSTNTIGYVWLPNNLCLESGYTILDGRILKTKTFPYGIYYVTVNRKLTQQELKTYDQVSNSYMTSTKKIFYENPIHSLPTTIEQRTNNNEVVVTKKKYSQEYSFNMTPPNQGGPGVSDLGSLGILNLQNNNIIGAEIESYQYRQNSDGSNKRYLGGSISIFSSTLPFPINLLQVENSQPLTSFQPSVINSSNIFTYDLNYKSVGSIQYQNGVIVEQTKTNDITTSYIWAYNNNMPIAEIVNATASSVAYTSFETDEGGNWNSSNGFAVNRVLGGLTGIYSFSIVGGATISKSGLPSKKYIVSYWSKNGQLSISPTPSKNITGQTVGLYTFYEHLLPLTSSVSIQGIAVIDELRLYPENALMSTTTYNYYTGQISSQCSPANKIAKFEYDGLLRLKNVLDERDNIVKNFKYNYGTVNTTTPSPQTLYYSAMTQQVFYKQGCPVGSVPQPYTYKVPYGKYVSVNSQIEANNKATAEIAANGQAAANMNGLCYFWNTEQKRRFFKNNCQPWEGPGGPYWYTVLANTYWSLISIADANAKALLDINNNGQNAANTFGSCSCTQEGYRYINGICELGGINYIGYEYVPNCAPNMNYRCYYVYTFSDGYQSPVYSKCSATAPCQNE